MQRTYLGMMDGLVDSFYAGCQSLAADRSPGEYWPMDDASAPMTLRPCPPQARWFVVSRDETIQEFFRSLECFPTGYPDDSGYAWVGRILSPSFVRVVRQEAEASALPIRYVCGLMPYDLACYVSLAVGGIGAERDSVLGSRGPDTVYSGISDPWLNTLDTPRQSSNFSASRRLRVASLAAKMPDIDLRAWGMLRSLPIEWSEIIGEQAMSLLDDGWMISLYSVMKPGAFDRRYASRVRELIFPDEQR